MKIFNKFYSKKLISYLPFTGKITKVSILIPRSTLNIFNALAKKSCNDYILNKHQNKVILISPIKTLTPIVTGISGIFQAPPCFYNDPQIPFKVSLMMLKLVFDLLCVTEIKNEVDLVLAIERFLLNAKELKFSYYYPLLQHFLSSLMAHFRFSPKILFELTDHVIDYTYYMDEKVSVNTIIEALVIKKVCLKFFKENKNKMKVIAQNPDHFSQEVKKHASEAYAIMKQPHPDFRLEIRFDGVLQKKFFNDVKLKVDVVKKLATCKGFISLTEELNKLKYMLRCRGDIGNVINQVTDIEEEELLEELRDEINKLLLNKKLTLNEKYNKFLEMQNKVDLNIKIKSLYFSRIVELESDHFFNDFYSNNPQLILELNKISLEIDLEALLPKKGQIANVDVWKAFYIKIIEKMPYKYQPLIKANLKIYFSIEG